MKFLAIVFALSAGQVWAQNYSCRNTTDAGSVQYLTFSKVKNKQQFTINFWDKAKLGGPFEGLQEGEFSLKGEFKTLSEEGNTIPAIEVAINKYLVAGTAFGVLRINYPNDEVARFYCTQTLKTKLVYDDSVLEGSTRNYLYEFGDICYKGFANEVPTLIGNLMDSSDSLLHWGQGIQAIRFGKHKVIYYAEQFFTHWLNDPDFADSYPWFVEENEREVNALLNYDINSDTVLVLSDLGPQGDGTELYATEIPKCKN